VLQIQLKKPVYGWYGRFKGMVRLTKGATSYRSAAAEKRREGIFRAGEGRSNIPNMTYGEYVKGEAWKNI
jgi:hypothetical protein